MDFFTFCVDIGRWSQSELVKCLSLMVKSLHKHIPDYHLICYTNFKIDSINLQIYNIEFREYYDNKIYTLYDDKYLDNNWLNLSFNKINIYKDLNQEFNKDFIWIDLDTVITYDISYVKDLSNFFIETGGNCVNDWTFFTNSNEFKISTDKYIQGNVWKLNINLYNEFLKTLNEILEKKLILRYDLQDLFGYYVYIKNNGNYEKANVNILGNTIRKETLNGLGIWDGNGNLSFPNFNALNNLYLDNGILKTKYYPEKEIHIVSFTFLKIRLIWNDNYFISLFNTN